MAYKIEFKAEQAKRAALIMTERTHGQVAEVIGVIKHAAKAGMNNVFISVPTKKVKKLQSVLRAQGYCVSVDMEGKVECVLNVEWF